jgi:hypothetical protein
MPNENNPPSNQQPNAHNQVRQAERAADTMVSMANNTEPKTALANVTAQTAGEKNMQNKALFTYLKI